MNLLVYAKYYLMDAECRMHDALKTVFPVAWD